MAETAETRVNPAGRVQAWGFNSSVRKGTIPGTLVLGEDRIRFEWDGGAVELPMEGVNVRAGGHENQQIFFEHPEHPAWSIYAKADSVLLHPVIAGHAKQFDLRRTVDRGRSPHRTLLWISAVVFGLVILLIGALFALKDPLVRFISDRIPPAWEQKLGDAVFAQVRAGGEIIEDSELKKTLDSVASKLLSGIPDPGYTFQFFLLRDTNINAFALPGGNVVVHTALIEASTPDQLAGVLAHEIAHVTQKHGLRKMIDAAGLSMIIQSLFGDASGLLAWMAESSEFLIRQKYSRDFEREADDVGWEYLEAASFDPRGMIEFFKKLHQIEQDQPRPPALLNTHPATEERIKRLEAKLESRERF